MSKDADIENLQMAFANSPEGILNKLENHDIEELNKRAKK
jgi:hypothetical protein